MSSERWGVPRRIHTFPWEQGMAYPHIPRQSCFCTIVIQSTEFILIHYVYVKVMCGIAVVHC
jgi:hypothetical protein